LHESKSIEEYAKELNITAVHLNRICQSIVQKSALQIVQDYLINEAKKYLLNTSYSVSEVSYFLNFKDPAYFTRLFKKQTGVSPSDFRKN
jgi:AraC family transcriptional regulator, transcriptional activator of pobA